MTIESLNDICLQGGYPNAFIYHICGMPWASTNDVAFCEWIKISAPEQNTLRAKLFGDDSLNVQVLPNLGNNNSNQLGAQTVNYSEDKGVSVGGWSVSISGDNVGFVWKNASSMEQWGIIGLDWQPVETTAGAVGAWMSGDIFPNLASSNFVDIQWNKIKDQGLKVWLDDNWNGSSYDEDVYIYAGSSCLRPIFSVQTAADAYIVTCEAGKLDAPNENILALKEKQLIFMSNYPQGIAGLTANLHSVLFKYGKLISGTTPFSERTGKIKARATQGNDGSWSIPMGGLTDQFKFKNTIGQLSANVSGYFFNKKDYTTGWNSSSEYHMPFLYVREVMNDGTGTYYSDQALLDLTSDYEEFASIEEIIDHMVSRMNGVSLTLDYSSSNGDIVYNESGLPVGHSVELVEIFGTAPYVSGVGYSNYEAEYSYYLNMMSDPINLNFCKFLDSPIVDKSQNLSAIHLRSFDEDIPRTDIFSTQSGVVNIRHTPLDYFIQVDLSQQKREFTDIDFFEKKRAYSLPEDTAGDQYLTIRIDGASEIELQSGMLLQFGNFGDEENGLSVNGETSTITNDKVSFASNQITGLPMSMYNNSSLINKINNDTEYQNKLAKYSELSGKTVDDIRGMFAGDLFKVKDVQNIVVSDAVDVFKGILGDPDTDIGLNVGAVRTDIKNLFNRGESNFVPMVDWDKLQERIDDNIISGMTFTYTPESNGSVDVLKLLTNLCLTFNVQMIWEYNPVYRCRWLTFDNFGSGNVASATLAGRTIEEQDIAENELIAMVGGDWYYNKLTGKFKSISGGDVNLEYQSKDGRTGNALKDKTLVIDDKITLLPIEHEDAQAEIVSRFGTMTRLFSQIVYNQKLILNLRKTALIGVGRWSTAEWAPIQNRQTGRRNDGALIGQIKSETVNLSTGLINVDMLSFPTNKVGIAPTFYADTMTTGGTGNNTVFITGLSTDPAQNDFGDTDSLLTDQMYFQCIDEVSGQLVDRACSCAGFRVTIFERNPPGKRLYFDPDYAIGIQNVFRGTIQKRTVATVTTHVYIVLDGNGANFDISKDWVVTFADRADADLCQCQIDLYGWNNDSANQVTDSDGNKSTGIIVGV